MKVFLIDNPSIQLTENDLKEIGVLHWTISVENGEANDPILVKLCNDRGYSYKDVVHVTPETLPNYSEKIKIFFQEHLHTDEEIRLFLEGSGYFDVRGKNDEWIRIHATKGDMILLPAGIYHRYSNDENNKAKVMRFLQGDPIWTPYNRANEIDLMKARKRYLESVKKNNK